MADVAAEKSPKKKMLLFIIIGVVALVLLVGGVLAAFFLLSSNPSQGDEIVAEVSHEDGSKKSSKKKDGEKHSPVFEKLPQFTVNLISDNAEVMQTDIALELPEAKMSERVKALLPKIQGDINKLLSSKHAEEIKTPEGRDKLGVEIRDLVNKILDVKVDEGIVSVNFTTFIIR